METTPLGRILIADDEEMFLHSIGDLLRQEGYECDCVPNAERAVEMIRENPYDLLISDIEMPGNPDLEMVHQLPQLAQGLPVILVTGYPSLRSAIQSVQLPVVAYLVKPIDVDDLLGRVRSYTERSQAYRMIRGAQERLRAWYADLNRLEEVMRSPVGNDASIPVNAFLTLTLGNIVGSLTEIRRLVEPLSQGSSDRRGDVFPGYPQPDKLMAALEETITVLEKTKSAFRSKDLGELRKKLEGLVKGTATCYSNDGSRSSGLG